MKHRLASFAAAAALVALVLPGIVAAADTQVVAGKVIGTLGTLMVASSNQMTVYTFDKDVAGSGVSNCSGGCLAAWPALTIAAGATPTAPVPNSRAGRSGSPPRSRISMRPPRQSTIRRPTPTPPPLTCSSSIRFRAGV